MLKHLIIMIGSLGMEIKQGSELVLRVARENAAFLYALLEAHDGVFNYTTLINDKHLGYRDIFVFSTVSMHEEMRYALETFRGSVDFQILPAQDFSPTKAVE